MKPALIIDLDGTACNAKHRLHHVEKPRGQRDWKTFFSLAHLDHPNEWCLEIIKRFVNDHVILFITSRGESDRTMTQQWIWTHLGLDVGPNLHAELHMRAHGDGRQNDTLVKREIYEREVAPRFKVLFAIDDKKGVCNLWREYGIAALHCDNWEDKAGEEVLGEINAHFHPPSIG